VQSEGDTIHKNYYNQLGEKTSVADCEQIQKALVRFEVYFARKQSKKTVSPYFVGENGKVTARQVRECVCGDALRWRRHNCTSPKRNVPRDMMGFLNRSQRKSHHISHGRIDTDTEKEPNVFMWYKTTSQH